MGKKYWIAVETILPSCDSVREAVSKHWPVDESNLYDLDDARALYTVSGTESLPDGDDPREIASRIVADIWKACNGYVPVKVKVRYVPDFPCEELEFDKDDYEALNRESYE